MVMALRLGDLLCCVDRTPIQVHEVTVRRRMRKDHAATLPIAGGMRPGARRRIAHTMLLRQGQGNTALLQVRFAAAPGQGRMEGGWILGRADRVGIIRAGGWYVTGERVCEGRG